MIMCVLLCYPISIHMLQLLSTGRPISSFLMWSDLTLGPSFKVKQGQSNLKVLITCSLLVL